MLRLNLTAVPEWLELAPGLRLQVAPLTTALMVSARADPVIEAVPEEASQEDLALTMAKSVARRAVLAWEGVGDAAGEAVPVTPENIDALLEVWPVFEAFQTQYVARGLLLEQEKNVSAPAPNGPSAGGDSYCAACPQTCQDCPARLNQPVTFEGWQVWDLIGRLGGQLRVTQGAVLGWDMGAAMALARALGIDTLIAAELLPEIEAVMVRKLNEQMEGRRDG